MKTKIIIALALFINVFATEAQYNIEVLDSLADGTIKFASIQSKVISEKTEDSKFFLKDVLKTDEGTDFYLRDVQTDEIGMTHEKYQQTHNGIKVAFREYIVHKDKEGIIVSINGDYGKLPKDIRQTPFLSFSEALEKGTTKKNMKNVTVHQLQKEKSVEKYTTQGTDEYELVYIMNNDNQWQLAYKVNLMPENIMEHCNAYFSTETGDIVFIQPLVFKTNAIGIAATRYSWVKSITTDSNNGLFRLREVSRGGSNTAIQTFNFLRNPAYNENDIQTGMANAVDFTDNDNNWTAAEFHNANNDDAALDAHWGAEMTFDYFRSIHSRNSYDNNNGTIRNYVNARTRDMYGNIINYDNAFWLGSPYNAMFYGNGNLLPPLVCLDIIAHEISHGICQFTAGLIYEKESGAINESLSDIWGACVENWAINNKQTWLCGEDLGTAFRSMSNPKLFSQPNTYGGTYWYNQNNCTPHWSNDYCGVHTNSGVMNYWFYLLSVGGNETNDKGNTYNVVGIGIDKAAKIVYRAENYYMTSSTNFNSARALTIQAATNLYESCSSEVVAVTNAWHAVGVGGISTEQRIISNVTYTTNTTITDCNVVLNDVNIQNNAKLTISNAKEVTINGHFEVALGSELEIE
jgi:bacillolysin